MNAISKIPYPTGGVDWLDVTEEDIATVNDMAAKLPWQWTVATPTVRPGHENDPTETYLDITPALGETSVPFWLPEFTIHRTFRGYTMSVSEMDLLYGEPADDFIEVATCDTIEDVMDYIPAHLSLLLEGWGLQRIARDLPDAA